MSLPLTTTKLQIILRSHAAECMQNEQCTMFAPQNKTFLFEQRNERFGSDCKNLTCSPLAFTHAFTVLVKFLTALLIAICPDHLQCLLELSNEFQVW